MRTEQAVWRLSQDAVCGPQGSADRTPTSLQQRNPEVKWSLEVTCQEGPRVAGCPIPRTGASFLARRVRWPQLHINYMNCKGQSSSQITLATLQLLEPRVSRGCHAGPRRSRTFPIISRRSTGWAPLPWGSPHRRRVAHCLHAALGSRPRVQLGDHVQ